MIFSKYFNTREIFNEINIKFFLLTFFLILKYFFSIGITIILYKLKVKF